MAKVEVAFSFDTTDSMSTCIDQVRKSVDKLCEDLFRDIPGLRIGLIAHGDYFDGDAAMSVLPLTDDPQRIKDFIVNNKSTSGGDAPECYEWALYEARQLGWSPDANKMLVMIGDDVPHEPNYPHPRNVRRLDWKEELGFLKVIGVRVYPLQCMTHHHVFWKEISEMCSTPLLRLSEFSKAAEILMGFAYAAAGEEVFSHKEQEVPSEVREELKVESRVFQGGS